MSNNKLFNTTLADYFMAKTKSKQKALVLFSGGLDSKLVIKLLQKKRVDVEAIFFKLPFGGGCCNDSMCVFKFSQMENVKLHIVDAAKGKNLKEYLDILKKPRYGTGAGVNPCIDCRIFMLKRAEKIKKKIGADFLATGEVLGERPMSQTKQALKIIDKNIPGIKRPLIEIGIYGRKRDKQIALARKFKIDYPEPAGGCLLCEKLVKERFKFLLDKDLINSKTLPLSKIRRHFNIKKFGWFVVGRNEKENQIIERYKNSIKSASGIPAVYYHKNNKQNKQKALELQKAYSKGGKKKFERFKLK